MESIADTEAGAEYLTAESDLFEIALGIEDVPDNQTIDISAAIAVLAAIARRQATPIQQIFSLIRAALPGSLTGSPPPSVAPMDVGNERSPSPCDVDAASRAFRDSCLRVADAVTSGSTKETVLSVATSMMTALTAYAPDAVVVFRPDATFKTSADVALFQRQLLAPIRLLRDWYPTAPMTHGGLSARNMIRGILFSSYEVLKAVDPEGFISSDGHIPMQLGVVYDVRKSLMIVYNNCQLAQLVADGATSDANLQLCAIMQSITTSMRLWYSMTTDMFRVSPQMIATASEHEAQALFCKLLSSVPDFYECISQTFTSTPQTSASGMVLGIMKTVVTFASKCIMSTSAAFQGEAVDIRELQAHNTTLYTSLDGMIVSLGIQAAQEHAARNPMANSAAPPPGFHTTTYEEQCAPCLSSGEQLPELDLFGLELLKDPLGNVQFQQYEMPSVQTEAWQTSSLPPLSPLPSLSESSSCPSSASWSTLSPPRMTYDMPKMPPLPAKQNPKQKTTYINKHSGYAAQVTSAALDAMI